MLDKPRQSDSKNILVIIPAYNEGRNIGEVVRKVKTCCNSDVLVIDDCSTDDTVPAAKSAGAWVISLPCNMGYGVAIQTGYKYAIRHGYTNLVQIDGDGQHDPAYINPMLNELDKKNADLVIGSRFLGIKAYEIPFFRRIGIKVFSFITFALIGRRINDITSGMQAMNATVIRHFCSDLFPHKYPDADVILWTMRKNLKIIEVPVQMHDNRGKSMHSGIFHPMKYALRMIFSMFIMRFLHHGEDKIG